MINNRNSNYFIEIHEQNWLFYLLSNICICIDVLFFAFSLEWVRCVFVRASLHMRRDEKPTRYHWMLYCTYNMLNMFRALLCPSSGARDNMCVITAYGVQCLVVGCRESGAGSRLWVQEEWCCTTSVVQQHSSWTLSLLPFTWPPTTSNQALHTIGGNNTI
jgi:hypothetical protein